MRTRGPIARDGPRQHEPPETRSVLSVGRLQRSMFGLELGERRRLETVATPDRRRRSVRREDDRAVLAFPDDDVVAGPLSGQRHPERALGFHLPQCGIGPPGPGGSSDGSLMEAGTPVEASTATLTDDRKPGVTGKSRYRPTAAEPRPDLSRRRSPVRIRLGVFTNVPGVEVSAGGAGRATVVSGVLVGDSRGA